MQGTWVQSPERSPGEGNGNPLQCSCLDTGAWRAIVYGVKKSQTGLSDFHFTTLLSIMGTKKKKKKKKGGGERE